MRNFQNKRKCIYFGNLDPEIDAKWLSEIVEPFGTAYNARVIPPKEKDGLTFGFVDMELGEAKELLDFFSKNELTYWGRVIKIKEAKGEISRRSRAIKMHICSKIREKEEKRRLKKLKGLDNHTGHSPME